MPRLCQTGFFARFPILRRCRILRRIPATTATTATTGDLTGLDHGPNRVGSRRERRLARDRNPGNKTAHSTRYRTESLDFRGSIPYSAFVVAPPVSGEWPLRSR